METASVQTGDMNSSLSERMKNSSSIYKNRKDLMPIKMELQKEVPEPSWAEYWNTFGNFIYGQCSKTKFDEVMERCLTTNKAKLLHNELIRSILFNAHFSMTPPPGVEIPAHKPLQKPPEETPKILDNQNTKFFSYTAADLHHLPSIYQLEKRVQVLTTEFSLSMSNEAMNTILNELKKYIDTILKKSRELAASEGLATGRTVVTLEHIQHTLKSEEYFSRLISPCVRTKFGMVAR